MTSDRTPRPGSARPEPLRGGGDGRPGDEPTEGPGDLPVVEEPAPVTGADASPAATGADEDGGGADRPGEAGGVAADDVAADDEAVEDDAAEAETRPRDARIRSAVEWVAVLAGAIVVALLVRTFLFTTFWIPSGSMEPTLMGGDRRDRVVVNRLAYRWGEPERGDIIVFKVPEGEPVTELAGGQQVNDLIKRVIGLPGETITLRDGKVYVDGELLDEPYLSDGMRTDPARPGVDTFEVPEDSVFVMGDNRTNSHDARAWEHPWVPEDDIVGEAFLRIWPLGEIGGL